MLGKHTFSEDRHLNYILSPFSLLAMTSNLTTGHPPTSNLTTQFSLLSSLTTSKLTNFPWICSDEKTRVLLGDFALSH